MDWRIGSLGLLVGTMSVLSPSSLAPIGLAWYSSESSIVLGMLISTGLVLTIMSLVRHGPASESSSWVLIIASAYVAVFIITLLAGAGLSSSVYSYSCKEHGTLADCNTAESIHLIGSLMFASLSIPVLTFLGATWALARKPWSSL